MSILSTLQQLRRGAFLDALDGEFRQLVLAVRDSGRKGALTIKLTVDPEAGDELQLTVVDTITTTMPKAGGGRTILFAGADGALSRQDPRQMSLLREVEAKAQAQPST